MSSNGGDSGGGVRAIALESKSGGNVSTTGSPSAAALAPENSATSAESTKAADATTVAIYVVTHIPGRLIASLPSFYVPIRAGRAAAAESAAPATAAADRTAADKVPAVEAKVTARENDRRPSATTDEKAPATTTTTTETTAPSSLTNVLRDGTSLDHERWSELSSMWRVWRDGPRTATVGFCHYRCFLNTTRTGHAWHGRDVRAPPGEFARLAPDLADGGAELWRSVDDAHIVVKRAEQLGASVVEHYARCHVALDYLLALALVQHHYPELAPAMLAQSERRTLYTRNVFVMSWRNFDALCTFLFGVLTRFCARVDWPRASRYQSRDVSFLSERLFDVWLRARQTNGSGGDGAGCQVTELPSVFVEFPEPGPEYGGRGHTSVP